MQTFRMLLIAGLAGIVTTGAVWIGWDLMYRAFMIFTEMRQRKKLLAEEAALNAPPADPEKGKKK